MLLSSMGLAAMDLLRPHDLHAQSCTPDPLGGEVCLPVEEPESPEDTINSSDTEGAQDIEGSSGSNNAVNDPDNNDGVVQAYGERTLQHVAQVQGGLSFKF